MQNRKIVKTDKAPAAIGPYSQGVISGGFLFCSGQVPFNPSTGELETASLADEAHRVMKNIEAILTEGGCTFSDVVKTTIFLKDMAYFAEVNEIYSSYFQAPYPARACMEVARLPRDVRVEIEAIAKVP